MLMMKTIVTMSPRSTGWYNEWIDVLGTEEIGDAGFNSATHRWHFPDQWTIVEQHAWLVQSLAQSHVAKVFSMTLDNFPEVSDSGVFIRDIFLSDQKWKILVSRFRRKDRAVQVQVLKQLVAILTEQWIEREIIIPPESENLYFEWGDFRYIAGSWILFAWLNTQSGLSRNSIQGIEWVRDTLEVPKEKLIIVDGKWFHLDTVKWVVTNKVDQLVWSIICRDLVRNFEEIARRLVWLGVKVLQVDAQYGIYSKEVGNRWAKWTINTLNLPGVLVWNGLFDEATEDRLLELGQARIVTQVSEFWNAGWGVHCLTNQI